MTSVPRDGYVTNPRTGRLCKIDSAYVKKLVKEGVIKLPIGQTTSPDESLDERPTEQLDEPKVESQTVIDSKLKTVVQAEARAIVNDRPEMFERLTQKQTDELLKRMLYEKLVLSNKKSNTKPTKPAKKKKTRFKLRQVESSSDDDSSDISD
jgi:hypothetical protein